MGKIGKLITSILLCISAGIIGVPFNLSALDNWYGYLNKPFFSPPNWVFEPVWTVLYILMGISLYLVWNKGVKTQKARDAVYFFGTQLVLNAVWSPVFFGLKKIDAALIIIIAMLFYIGKTIKAFSKIDKRAAILLYPYFLWVTFATLLNLGIVVLNRTW